MSPYEVILETIKELNKFYTDTGEFSGEQYYHLLDPLHQALLNLTKAQTQTEIKNDHLHL